MLCDRCKVREATYHSTVNINGKVSESHLCSECAISENKVNNIFNLGNFFTSPFDLEEDVLISDEERSKDKLVCEGCGKTYDEFLSLGLLGCSKCYETFENQLLPVIKSTQADMQHVGKKIINNENIESDELKIKNLEFKLKQAVASENYELASEIKKQINQLKSGGN